MREKMLVLFFNRISWPTSLPTNEKETFVLVEKQNALDELLMTNSLPLQPGLENSEKVVATLLAGAEYARLPVNNCVLIAGSQPGVLGAQRIGMPCIVLRSSLTSRAKFPSADAVMDGFGGADLTLSRLQRMGGC